MAVKGKILGRRMLAEIYSIFTPERKKQTTWKTFLEAHWDVLAAIDFTTIEIWTKSGLRTFYLLFVMEIVTRRIYFAGCTSNPDEDWMLQVGRNLTDSEDGFLKGKRYLLMDRDKKYSEAFRSMVKGSGVEPVRLSPKSPNMNAHMDFLLNILISLTSEAPIVGRWEWNSNG